MTHSSATHAHEHSILPSPTTPIEAQAVAADATGIARAQVGGHEILVEGGGNFDLAPSSAEILMGALAADVLQQALNAAERRGIAVAEAKVDVITHFYAGLLGGVESDDPIGPHDFTATITILAPNADEADLDAIRREASDASAIAGLLRAGSFLRLDTEGRSAPVSGLARHIQDRAAGLEALRAHARNTPQAADPTYWRRPLIASARSSHAPGVSRLRIRDRFAVIADAHSILAPSPLELTIASLATCLTHTAIMHAALDGAAFDSAHALLRYERMDEGNKDVVDGTLAIGMSDGDVLAGKAHGGNALEHCLLVHCLGRRNLVNIK